MKKLIFTAVSIALIMPIFLIKAKNLFGSEIDLTTEKQTINQKEEIIVNFSSPISIQEMINLTKEENIQPVEIYYEMHGISGGYTLKQNENIETALNRMMKQHVKFLKFVLKENKNILKLNKNKKENFGLLELNKQFLNVLQDSQKGKFKLSGMKLDSENNLSVLLKKGIIKNFPESLKEDSEKEQKNNIKKDLNVYSKGHESWAPYKGTSKVTRSQTYQTFYFDNILGFWEQSTYEHETQIYDNNFANYDGYWSSNLPRAYKDTQFLDDIDDFTVGSAQASEIKLKNKYYTYMSLKRGKTKKARVKIRGQIGFRFPSWCYSLWCVIRNQTTFPGALADYEAPGTVRWTY